jgi:hypothetical protein
LSLLSTTGKSFAITPDRLESARKQRQLEIIAERQQVEAFNAAVNAFKVGSQPSSNASRR